ncbi:MAG: hypothetical protein ABFD60_10600 [Bryobacteraceae bacterium]
MSTISYSDYIPARPSSPGIGYPQLKHRTIRCGCCERDFSGEYPATRKWCPECQRLPLTERRRRMRERVARV